ncbi:hypothetical protein JMJ56_31070 [Belnapia sp. T18]|uniref:Uncharacterized protein n=1 Tax=Belnapia arida TaxID=2804533 RepID=A0ABS1UCK6_9PROT|nr:hypothetical protein [Belnapia arida]MBL6082411.1 hypothetical protein [Belnapia arida]
MQSDWSDEGDVGILIRNIDASIVDIRRAERFTIGVQLQGDARGCEDSDLRYGRLIDNRIGLDLRTLTASGWMNSLRHQGGHFACSSATNPTQPRFGVRLSAAAGAYRLHNTHLFNGPAFELQRQGTPGAVDAIPFLVEVDGRCLIATGVRMEACSPHVARHTGGFSDARYEVSYVGTYGFLGCSVQYQGASRAGGTVVPMHQATAAIAAPRLVAGAENLRTLAFRQSISVADGVGFDQLAVLSGNPAGPPSTLNGFCFPGLNAFTLNADDVTIPTSRGLAYVVDCSQCKEFFIAAEGSGMRPVVMQFDGAENVLGTGSPVLFSNMNAVMQGAPSYWWEGNADLDSLTGGLALNRLQRVTLSAEAQYAAIGIRGSSAGAVLRSLRLYTSALHAPRVLFGGSRAWGKREYTVSDGGWTIPALAAGATATYDVTLPGVRQGDFVRAGFARRPASRTAASSSTPRSAARPAATKCASRRRMSAADQSPSAPARSMSAPSSRGSERTMATKRKLRIEADFAGAVALVLADYRRFVGLCVEEPDEAVVKAFASRHTAGRTALAHADQLLKLAADAGCEAQQQAITEVLAEWRRIMPQLPEEENDGGAGG